MGVVFATDRDGTEHELSAEEGYTMMEILRDAGHSNWAFVANNQVAGRGIQFEQGFHRFVAPRAFLP